LVTGAGRGIGRAIALELAKAGVVLVLVGRDRDALNAAASQVAALGASATVIPSDLGKADAAAKVVAMAHEQFGCVDLLINNAGRIEPLARPESTDPDQWADTISLNLVAPFRLIRACLPRMLDRKFGRIVNISSAGATGTGTPSGSAYASSKAGLEMMTRNLGAELAGSEVRICAIRPGPVDTDMHAQARAMTSSPSADVPRARSLFNDLHASGRLRSADGPARFVITALLEGANGAILDFDPDFRPSDEGKHKGEPA
jgi:NAD(P)-dependent dehydrogenase (short-subunit alcohol dehydrogenase family)